MARKDRLKRIPIKKKISVEKGEKFYRYEENPCTKIMLNERENKKEKRNGFGLFVDCLGRQ